MQIANPNEAIQKGIGYLPEDRSAAGARPAVGALQERDPADTEELRPHGVAGHQAREHGDEGAGGEARSESRERLDTAATLSGGNQQKIIVAKLLAGKLKVIILDEPTKGVDVGAKTAIFNIMNDLAATGYGIIMVSSEMAEVLGMSDRIRGDEGGQGVRGSADQRSHPGVDTPGGGAGVGGRMRRAATFSESFRELGLLVFIVILCAIFQFRNHNFLECSPISATSWQTRRS